MDDTRTRILNAAGPIFAEKGFQAARVREICEAAGVNLASVNYYFGDKEGLYAEVLRQAHCAADEHCPLEFDPELPPREKLREFVRGFLMRLFDPEKPAWHGLLMARELFEPTEALDTLIERYRASCDR